MRWLTGVLLGTFEEDHVLSKDFPLETSVAKLQMNLTFLLFQKGKDENS